MLNFFSLAKPSKSCRERNGKPWRAKKWGCWVFKHGQWADEAKEQIVSEIYVNILFKNILFVSGNAFYFL